MLAGRQPDEVNGHLLPPKRSFARRVRDAWGSVVELGAAGVVAVVVPLLLVVVIVVLAVTGRIHFGG
jgi:hypothetical protein